jgi:hypothetical protein
MGLYEGLLRGMDKTLAAGDITAAVIAANEPGSEFRKMFGVSSYNEEPFSATEENGELVFTINNEGNGVWAECGKGARLSAISPDITAIKCAGGIRIIAKDDNIADALCKTIIADNISVHQATEVKDVDLFAKNIAPKRIIPNMQFDSTVKKVTNCTIELDYANTTASRIIFYNLPEFNNVRSNSVRNIEITDNPIKFNGIKPQDIFGNAHFKKIFDFGYELSYVDDFVVQTSGKVVIKDMKGIRRLVTAKDFYNREFAEWPYRLKPGAKLSDFIDVSQFNNLSSIIITDKKMGVLFENVDNPCGKQHASFVYFTDMLKQTWEEKAGHKRNEIDKLIPVTADGWRVIIYRY